jgi:hypothetical protein
MIGKKFSNGWKIIVLRGYWLMLMIMTGLWVDIRKMKRSRAFSSLREGGAARRKDGFRIVTPERTERAARDVWRRAVDAGHWMIHS